MKGAKKKNVGGEGGEEEKNKGKEDMWDESGEEVREKEKRKNKKGEGKKRWDGEGETTVRKRREGRKGHR